MMLPVVSSLVNLPRLVQGLRTPCLIILRQMISDQDLLRGWSDIILEHRILVYSPEQVIHRCKQFLRKRLEKWRAWADASLEDLQNGNYTAGFNLEHYLPEPLHEVP